MSLTGQSTSRALTRAELLQRLRELEAAGEDMALPAVVCVTRDVEDKRRRQSGGTRREYLYAHLTSVRGGSLQVASSGQLYGALEAKVAPERGTTEWVSW